MSNEAHNHNHLDPEHEDLDQSPPETMGGSIYRAIWGLGLFAVITAGLIAATQLVTRDQIAYQVKQARAKALLAIVPLNSFDNDLVESVFTIDATDSLGLVSSSDAFVATKNKVPTHLILPAVAPDGYTGPIHIIASISHSGVIRGVRVIKHKETPGLGDKIDLRKSDWIRGFEGKSLDNTPTADWKVKKDGGDFDQLTGATITPRAIVQAVYKALLFFRENREALYEQAGLVSGTPKTITQNENK